MKIAILFPGQGSQFVGMGKEFIENSNDCATLMDMAEKVCGIPLGDICQKGPMEELTRSTNIQPAITITNLICWQAFLEATQGTMEVSCFAGHSLGEYAALYAAGVISAEDTMRLVSKRGSLMEREGNANPGGMRAVLGLTIDKVEAVIERCQDAGALTAANHNCPEQIVLSGTMAALDKATGFAEAEGGKVIPLNVSVANHSPLVANAVPDFTAFMEQIEFENPGKDIYCNVSACKESDSQTIKSMMARQIASRVRWYEIISGMLSEGVDTFIEVGPKKVLTGMMKKIVPKGTKVASMQFETPAGLAKCIEKITS